MKLVDQGTPISGLFAWSKFSEGQILVSGICPSV